MKKIKLDLEKLSVESFETAELKKEKGTVKANKPILPDPPYSYTCDPCYSGMNSCEGTCYEESCQGTCPFLP